MSAINIDIVFFSDDQIDFLYDSTRSKIEAKGEFMRIQETTGAHLYFKLQAACVICAALIVGCAVDGKTPEPGRDVADPGLSSVQLDIPGLSTPGLHINASTISGNVPLDVSFTATVGDLDIQVESVAWSFGSGKTGQGLSSSTTYPLAGNYTVEVQITDSDNEIHTATSTIEVLAIPGDTNLVHASFFPSRITQGGPVDNIYVSDAKQGSVFIYDAQLNLTGEIKNLVQPMGVAVDTQGNVYVGSDGQNTIAGYTPAGDKFLVIEEGEIQMPNDMVLDENNNLYVVDSKANLVKVFSPDGFHLANIGATDIEDNALSFPAALAIHYPSADDGRLYVADQKNSLIRVYNLEGDLLNSFGGPAAAFSGAWEGKFVRIQSLAVDAQGSLHALDVHQNLVEVFELPSGTYTDYYGSFGPQEGELSLPLDIHIDPEGNAIIANAGNRRLEVM